MTLAEEAFGLIQTITRLERTNPSVDINRMDGYQAMHHEISDVQCIKLHFFRLHAIIMMPRKVDFEGGRICSDKDNEKA